MALEIPPTAWSSDCGADLRPRAAAQRSPAEPMFAGATGASAWSTPGEARLTACCQTNKCPREAMCDQSPRRPSSAETSERWLHRVRVFCTPNARCHPGASTEAIERQSRERRSSQQAVRMPKGPRERMCIYVWLCSRMLVWDWCILKRDGGPGAVNSWRAEIKQCFDGVDKRHRLKTLKQQASSSAFRGNLQSPCRKSANRPPAERVCPKDCG